MLAGSTKCTNPTPRHRLRQGVHQDDASNPHEPFSCFQPQPLIPKVIGKEQGLEKWQMQVLSASIFEPRLEISQYSVEMFQRRKLKSLVTMLYSYTYGDGRIQRISRPAFSMVCHGLPNTVFFDLLLSPGKRFLDKPTRAPFRRSCDPDSMGVWIVCCSGRYCPSPVLRPFLLKLKRGPLRKRFAPIPALGGILPRQLRKTSAYVAIAIARRSCVRIPRRHRSSVVLASRWPDPC